MEKPAVEKKEKTGEEQSEDEEEDISKEKLNEMGIYCKRDLHRSLKKSTANILKRSSLRKMMQARDAKKQRKAQARKNIKKKKQLKKNGKQPRKK